MRTENEIEQRRRELWDMFNDSFGYDQGKIGAVITQLDWVLNRGDIHE